MSPATMRMGEHRDSLATALCVTVEKTNILRGEDQ
jgi:hypothetical protein